jgi:uridine kinase
MLILVGGCSRAGKTILVSKLTENIISSGVNAANEKYFS